MSKFIELYGENCDIAAQKERYAKLSERFKTSFGVNAENYYSASGRAEIMGNHTDHNHGKTIVAAVTCDTIAAVNKTDDKKITILSEGYDAITVGICDHEPNENEYSTSTAIVKGIICAIRKKGYSFGGFQATVSSNVFNGAGVSSSASFELLICEIINDLYLNGKLKKTDKAIIGQYAENVFFGKPCGLLDQCGVSLGSINAVDFKNPEKPVIEKLAPLTGYSLVITNTGGSHSSLTSHYAAIKSEMKDIAEFFGKQYLREVNKEDFYLKMPTLKRSFNERSILRAMHFLDENERVEQAADALKKNDDKMFLSSFTASGDSSLINLQNCFVSGSTVQPIVLGIQLSKHIIKKGGVRIHGGGFAGTIIAYISNDEVIDYVHKMKLVFGDENVFVSGIRSVGATKVDF